MPTKNGRGLDELVASRQAGAIREARTIVKRCQGVHRTRPASFRLATMSCCRRSAFSVTSSTRRRTRSAASRETNRRRSNHGSSLTPSARMTFVARTGVVDVDQERAARTAVLEPGVLATIDLHELAQAFAPVAWLMRRPDPLAPGDPDAGTDQPSPQRFPGHLEIVQLEKLLARQRGAEVDVALAHDLDGLRSQLVRQAPIARLPALV